MSVYMNNKKQSIVSFNKALDLKVYGNSEQEGVPTLETPIEIEIVGDKTKNLIDIEKILTTSILTQNEDGVYKLSFTSTGRFTKAVDLFIPANTKITLSMDILEYTGTSSSKFNVHFYMADGTHQYISLYDKGINKKNVSYDLDIVKVRFYQQSSNEIGDYTTFKNLMIELGNTATEYEPYGYKVPIKATGKNLFDYSTILEANKIEIIDEKTGEFVWKNSSGIPPTYIDAKENTQYFVSFKAKTMKEQTAIIVFYYTDGTYKGVEAVSSPEGFVTVSGISQPNKTVDYVKFGGSGGLSIGSIFKELQIEEGDKATDYESYFSKTIDIYLKEPLRKIGDYADYIDYKNKKVVRNIYRLYFKDKTWSTYNSGLDTQYYYIAGITPTALIAGTNKSTILCNIMDSVNVGNTNLQVGISIFNNGIMRARPSLTEYRTVAEWTEYLKNTDGYIDYIIAPTEEMIDIPETSLNRLTKNVIIDTNIQPSFIDYKIEYKLKKMRVLLKNYITNNEVSTDKTE